MPRPATNWPRVRVTRAAAPQRALWHPASFGVTIFPAEIAPDGPESGKMAPFAEPRALISGLKRKSEQALHPHRRRRILKILGRDTLPSAVLFICYGNICRSPFAAESLRQRLSPPVRDCIAIASAGFYGPGRPPPSTALSVAAAMGIDMSYHRSRLVESPGVKAFDWIFVMDPVHARMLHSMVDVPGRVLVLGDLDPNPIETRLIHDPIGQSAEVFERVYRRIDACTAELARILQNSAGT